MYDVFLSHAHEDREVALELKQALESLAVPMLRSRGMTIFLDQHELAAGDRIAELRAHVGDSRHVLLLCSPAAAASEWVTRELAWFMERARADDVLVVLVRGELRDALSPAQAELLGGLGAIESRLYEDLRAWPTWRTVVGDNLDEAQRKRDFRLRALARLAAPVRGVRPSELVGEHITRRRRIGLTVGVAGLSVALVLALAGAATLRRAEAESRVASAGAFQAAEGLSRIDPGTAVGLALAATGTDPGRSTVELVPFLDALDGANRILQANLDGMDTLAVSPGGWKVAGSDGARVVVWDADTGRVVRDRVLERSSTEEPREGDTGGTRAPESRCLSVDDGGGFRVVVGRTVHDEAGRQFEIDADVWACDFRGGLLATAQAQRVTLWSADGTRIAEGEVPESEWSDDVAQVAVHGDHVLATDGVGVAHCSRSGARLLCGPFHGEDAGHVAWTWDGRAIVGDRCGSGDDDDDEESEEVPAPPPPPPPCLEIGGQRLAWAASGVGPAPGSGNAWILTRVMAGDPVLDDARAEVLALSAEAPESWSHWGAIPEPANQLWGVGGDGTLAWHITGSEPPTVLVRHPWDPGMLPVDFPIVFTAIGMADPERAARAAVSAANGAAGRVGVAMQDGSFVTVGVDSAVERFLVHQLPPDWHNLIVEDLAARPDGRAWVFCTDWATTFLDERSNSLVLIPLPSARAAWIDRDTVALLVPGARGERTVATVRASDGVLLGIEPADSMVRVEGGVVVVHAGSERLIGKGAPGTRPAPPPGERLRWEASSPDGDLRVRVGAYGRVDAVKWDGGAWARSWSTRVEDADEVVVVKDIAVAVGTPTAVHLLHPADGRELAEVPLRGVYGFALGVEGSRLVIVDDERIRSWDLDPDALHGAACATGAGDLDSAAWRQYGGTADPPRTCR